MSEESSTKVLQANNDFTNSWHQVLSKKNGNFIFSPISLHMILSLVYQGAGGDTAKAFASALYLPNTIVAKDGYKILIQFLNNAHSVTLYAANKIYIKSGYHLKAMFEEVAENFYNSNIEHINFEDQVNAAKTINTWVTQNTNKKITHVVSSNSLEDTRILLINAIHFESNWAYTFKPIKNQKPFFPSANEEVMVDMMRITYFFPYNENTDLGAKILELPYKNSEFSMLIFLPYQKNGIEALEAKLASTSIVALARSLNKVEVQIIIPKFRFEYEINLKDALEELGLGVIFEDTANFSGFLEGQDPLSVSKIIQKLFIEVNEEGTDASVATRVVMRPLSTRYAPRYFTADHPFIFALIARKGNDVITLFQGRVISPKY